MNKEHIDQCFRILGCEPGASLAEVKKEYRNLAQVFHPDKYEAGSTRQEWAANRLIQINDAYDKLKDFFSKCPDGIPPQGWTTQTVTPEPPGWAPQAPSDSDGFFDWQTWQKSSNQIDDISLSDWAKQQEQRQQNLTSEDGRNNRRKLVFYAKLAACIFVCMLWMGRAGSNEATKIAVETERQNILGKQGYDNEHQGTNIDGFGWSDLDLQNRHDDEMSEFVRKNEQKSAEICASGWAMTFLTLFVIWALIAPASLNFTKTWAEGKSHATT